MPNITSIRPKAVRILDLFFVEIRGLNTGDFNQHQKLLRRTKKLFLVISID